GGDIFLHGDGDAELFKYGRMQFVHQGTDIAGKPFDCRAHGSVTGAVRTLAQREQMTAHAVMKIARHETTLLFLRANETAQKRTGAVACEAQGAGAIEREIEILLRPAREQNADRGGKDEI